MFAYLHRILPFYYLILSILLGLTMAWTFSCALSIYLDSPQSMAGMLRHNHATPASAPSAADDKIILQRNIFDSAYTPESAATAATPHTSAGTPATKGAAKLPPRPLKQAANMKLVGTIAGKTEALAVINVGGTIDIYRRNDLIADSSRIEQILRLRVRIQNADGTVTILNLDEESPSGRAAISAPRKSVSRNGDISQIDATSWNISREKADAIKGNIGEIVRQARIEPIVSRGQTTGFIVKYIQPGTLLTQMGLRRGDVIKQVNGIDLNSPEKGLQVFQQLREARTMNLNIERSNTPMTFKYEIK